jgi:hypothetical protein
MSERENKIKNIIPAPRGKPVKILVITESLYNPSFPKTKSINAGKQNAVIEYKFK